MAKAQSFRRAQAHAGVMELETPAARRKGQRGPHAPTGCGGRLPLGTSSLPVLPLSPREQLAIHEDLLQIHGRCDAGCARVGRIHHDHPGHRRKPKPPVAARGSRPAGSPRGTPAWADRRTCRRPRSGPAERCRWRTGSTHSCSPGTPPGGNSASIVPARRPRCDRSRRPPGRGASCKLSSVRP